MKSCPAAAAALALVFCAFASAVAEPHHPEWKEGGHIARADWGRGQRVDFHARHLRPPPPGYEWRLVDGTYVLAAISTGVIASVIVANQ
jgi:Ni/Co efflux regulator RcnB